jgi:hypothetical protein
MKKVAICTAFALLFTANTIAQKLPGKQDKSVRAPGNIKIDGTAAEWDNKFQAHNNATDVSYTLSNDDNKLYLIIEARYKDVIDKIIMGGVTLTINTALKKTDKNAINITYPVLRGIDMSMVSNLFSKKSIQKKEEKLTTINVTDLNQLLETKDKLINIAGIVSITDPSISIYNDTGIKAASKFDGSLAYTCELAIPLSLISSPNDGNTFSYRIKINPPAAIGPLTAAEQRLAPPPPPMVSSTFAATDLWGEYTLAK